MRNCSLVACIVLATPLPAQVVLDTFVGDTGRAAGDVDLDGVPDLIIGADRVAVVYAGSDGRVLHRFPIGPVFVGTPSPAVDGGQDLDGDGHADLVVGWPTERPCCAGGIHGVVRAYSGADGSLIHETWAISSGDALGSAVAMTPDITQDGVPDYLAGAPDAPAGNRQGYVVLYSGATGLLAQLHSGITTPHRFGFSVASPGDVDQDGTPDIFAGNQQRGIARVISGRTQTEIYRFTDPQGVQRFVSAVGDVNADNVPDLLVGGSSLTAFVYSGADGSLIHQKSGNSTFGDAVSGAGDLDRDGHHDFLVGEPGDATRAGRVHAFSGRTGQPLFVWRGGAPGDGFGSSIAPAGDVNGDGGLDLLIGRTSPRTVTLYSADLRPLTVDTVSVSVSGAGRQRLFLNAGPPHSGKLFVLTGSLSGTTPGTQLGPVVLPLNLDPYFAALVASPNSLIVNSAGTLNPEGAAQAEFRLPAGLPPSAVGTMAHHAFIAATPFPFGIDFASNAVPLRLVQ